MALNKINNAMVNNQANMWKYYYIATAGQTVFGGADTGSNVLVVNSGSEEVTLNGVVLKPGVDYTVNNNTITLTTGATLGSELNVTVYGMFNVANTYSMSQVDNKITTVQQGVYGFKNHIINGNFDIWQRGTSQTTDGYGSDDRWANYNNGSTKTHSQVTCTDTERALFNATAFSRTVVTSVAGAGNYAVKQQHIEDITKLAGKTVTVSFWAKADSNKKLSFNIAQLFGTGGSPSAPSYYNAVTVNITSSWQKITATFNIPSIVGKTLGTDGIHTTATIFSVQFDAGATAVSSYFPTSTVGQQSGTFDIAQVQLEEGSVATPFENRPIGLELSLCQRYYNVLGGNDFIYGNSTGDKHATINFPFEMRSAPTVALISPYNSTYVQLYSSKRITIATNDAPANGSIGFDGCTLSAEL